MQIEMTCRCGNTMAVESANEYGYVLGQAEYFRMTHADCLGGSSVDLDDYSSMQAALNSVKADRDTLLNANTKLMEQRDAAEKQLQDQVAKLIELVDRVPTENDINMLRACQAWVPRDHIQSKPFSDFIDKTKP